MIFDRFRAELPFDLDDFQVAACESLQRGTGVLVAAPTGSGKTVVAHFGIELAIERGQRAFYTTPIKALSNQKYHELKDQYDVGLLTGDVSINPGAQVIVMTTEVLRNMLYNAPDDLADLGLVVMDEVHYLSDRERGPVWEEVLIHLPTEVQVVSLSATVSNAEEFGEWLGLVRGETDVILSEKRPVPLWQHVMVSGELYDLYEGRDVNPSLMTAVRTGRRRRVLRSGVVAELDRDGLLPAIYFVFSRAGCEDAFGQLANSSLTLTTADEEHQIREIVRDRVSHLNGSDLATLGYHQWLRGLARGVAAHHAGMIPLFKETVEELFGRGLIKVVFATETLALGINMPARSVVLERLDKWDGSSHAPLTPGEYTQLTGRAGRRGIDIEGHAVVLHSHAVRVEDVARLASTRTYPLRSAFRPTCNMAVNLLARMSREKAHEVLQLSFAQFQADRSVVSLARQVRSLQSSLPGLADAVSCDRGDIHEYLELRASISQRERAATRRKAPHVEPGSVIAMQQGRHFTHAVVSRVAGKRIDAVTDRARQKRLSPNELAGAEVLGSIRVTNPRSPQGRVETASRLREFVSGRMKNRPKRPKVDRELESLRSQMRAHPCHSCPDIDAHARDGRRWQRARAQERELRRQIDDSTGTLAQQFDRLCALLEELGYLADDVPTPDGQMLRKIYGECDLLTAECIRRGLWDELAPEEFAGAISAVATEARSTPAHVGSSQPLRRAIADTTAQWRALRTRERAHAVPETREIDGALAATYYQWARGSRLDGLLGEMLPGDFVRSARQIIDSLDQLAGIEEIDDSMRRSVRRAKGLVDRDVVSLHT